jgi:hypothetical protein
MGKTRTNDLSLNCPCCGARLLVDLDLRKVIAHEAPARNVNAPDLDRAAVYLKEQAERREELFKQSSEEEKKKAQILERKFAEALKKSKDQPVTKPMRDIDL